LSQVIPDAYRKTLWTAANRALLESPAMYQ